MRKLIAPLLVSLTLIFCAIGCDAQAQTTITVKQALPDGEFVLVIDGVEQRTITAQHARQIAERNADLDKCTRARAVIDEALLKYDQQIALLTKDAELADLQAAKERERAGRFEFMFTSENALRLKAEELNSAHGKGNWLTKLLDNPYVDAGFKAVVPTVNLVRSFRN